MYQTKTLAKGSTTEASETDSRIVGTINQARNRSTAKHVFDPMPKISEDRDRAGSSRGKDTTYLVINPAQDGDKLLPEVTPRKSPNNSTFIVNKTKNNDTTPRFTENKTFLVKENSFMDWPTPRDTHAAVERTRTSPVILQHTQDSIILSPKQNDQRERNTATIQRLDRAETFPSPNQPNKDNQQKTFYIRELVRQRKPKNPYYEDFLDFLHTDEVNIRKKRPIEQTTPVKIKSPLLLSAKQSNRLTPPPSTPPIIDSNDYEIIDTASMFSPALKDRVESPLLFTHQQELKLIPAEHVVKVVHNTLSPRPRTAPRRADTPIHVSSARQKYVEQHFLFDNVNRYERIKSRGTAEHDDTDSMYSQDLSSEIHNLSESVYTEINNLNLNTRLLTSKQRKPTNAKPLKYPIIHEYYNFTNKMPKEPGYLERYKYLRRKEYENSRTIGPKHFSYTFKEYKRFRDDEVGLGPSFLNPDRLNESNDQKIEKVNKRNSYSELVRLRNLRNGRPTDRKTQSLNLDHRKIQEIDRLGFGSV